MEKKDKKRALKLESYLVDLNARVASEESLPLIGRERELRAMEETLLRKFKNNVLLSGLPGVGKSALVKELCRRINSGSVVPLLKEKVVMQLSLNNLFIYHESLEKGFQTLEQIFKSLEREKERVILFLDDLQLFPAPLKTTVRSSLAMFQNLLKFQLTNHSFPIILAATPEEEQRFIRSDEFLSLNFNPVILEEPAEKEVINILSGIKSFFENYYRLTINQRLLPVLYRLSGSFLPFRAFPDKAIELLDNSCSKAALQKARSLRPEHIYESLAAITKLDSAVIRRDPRESLKDLRPFLERNVINQLQAKEEVIRILNLASLENRANQHHPQAIFLFLGPAGCGKSYFAMKLAEFFFDSPDKLRIIDLSALKKAEDSRKLIIADDEPGILLQEVINHPFSVIFLENIDEAHSSVLYNLGKILTRGEIRLASGKKFYLSTNIFILSLTHIGEAKEKAIIGFVQGNRENKEFIVDSKIISILDWIDEIIQFNPYELKDLIEISRQNLEVFRQFLKKNYRWQLRYDQKLLRKMAEDALASGKFAHRVKEIIERDFKAALVELQPGKSVSQILSIEVVNGQYQFSLGRK